MSNIPTTEMYHLTNGLDRSRFASASAPGTFYNLQNLRHTFDAFGRLEQTPYFYAFSTTPQGTYYNAGSQTEPSSSSVRGYILNPTLSEAYTITDYCVTVGVSTQVPVFYQTTVPTPVTINTQCFLSIISVTGLGITLGQSLDIEIDGATTFKWRKNGGAYTTAVPITTTGVTIGGVATIYFLTATGFTVGHVWSWTRTDSNQETSFTFYRATEFENYERETYYLNVNLRLMMLRASTTGTYAISVGYRPVYGAHFAFFEKHLMVTGYSTSPYESTTSLTSTQHLLTANSDVVDVHNFFPTDVNEADTFSLPTGTATLGCFVLNNRFFICVVTGLFYTDYTGLPTPFSYKLFLTLQFAIPDSVFNTTYYFMRPTCTQKTDLNRVYLVGAGDLWVFDGSTATPFGAPIRAIVNTPITAVSGWVVQTTYYDTFRGEYLCVFQGQPYIFVYVESSRTFYTRSIDFTTSTNTDVGCISRGNHYQLVIGTYARVRLREDYDFTRQPVFDATNGTTYAVPKATFQSYIGQGCHTVKDITEVYLAAGPQAGSASAFYTVSTSLNFQIYWSVLDSGEVSTMATNTGAVTNSSLPNGYISFPRIACRTIAFEIQFVQISTKPPGGGYIYNFEPFIRENAAR